MQEEWVICRILHKSGDQSSKLMMMTNPYYLPMGMDASSFCFQHDPAAAPPLPNPSGCTSVVSLPFHHGHHGMQPPLLPASSNQQQGSKISNGCGFPASAACTQEPPNGYGRSSNAMGMPPYPPLPFTSVVAGAGRPAPPPPQAGVNAGPQEPLPAPPTWLDGGILYELGPGAAAPRDA